MEIIGSLPSGSSYRGEITWLTGRSLKTGNRMHAKEGGRLSGWIRWH